MQKIGLNRNTIDKYYTKLDVVNQCIDIIKHKLNINKNEVSL